MENLKKLFKQLSENSVRVKECYQYYLTQTESLFNKYSEVVEVLRNTTDDEIEIERDNLGNILLTFSDLSRNIHYYRIRFLPNGNFIAEYSTPKKDYEQEVKLKAIEKETKNLTLLKMFLDRYVNSKIIVKSSSIRHL